MRETCGIVRMDIPPTRTACACPASRAAHPEAAMPEYTATLIIRGEGCDYDPEEHVARIPCENCGHINEVEVWTDDAGAADFSGFACENCGHWNGPG